MASAYDTALQSCPLGTFSYHRESIGRIFCTEKEVNNSLPRDSHKVLMRVLPRKININFCLVS